MKLKKNRWTVLFIVAFVITAVWVIQLMLDIEPYVDRLTRDMVVWLEDSFLMEPFQFITHLGSSFFLYPFVISVAILLFIWYRDYVPALFFAGGVYLANLINKGIKFITARERPSISPYFNAEGYSFPSGHAMVSLICYGLLAYFLIHKLKKTWQIITVQLASAILIFLIGMSRYILNVHYLTDVLAGFFFGILLLISYIFLYERIQQKRRKISPSEG